ncbi:Porin-like protein NicP [Pseudomonas fluorescens]|uniref:Porin-like protein NicP n=1 Tax=Pseudomonas fluorescens TaxID=294 RepID=A0A5E6PQ45_PSEFL|nr:OprD family porin [Pseudomonas fluorescens]VVM43165.1 Porin-like protein NicP [Pseudomonas fluorescens]
MTQASPIKPLLLSTLGCLLAGPDAALADFIADNHGTLNVRNFYFNNDYRDQPGPQGQSKLREWGNALMLDLKSGYTDGALGFGLDAFGTLGVRLDGGAGNHRGSSMFPDDSDGSAVDEYSRLGLTAKARFANTELRVGTLQPKLPILVSNDGRLLPQTFEGAMLTSKAIDSLTLVGGRLTKTTGRASSNDSGLAVAGGRRESDDFSFAGADYQVNKQLLLQYYRAQLDNYYDQDFMGLTHLFPVVEGQTFKTDLRYFRTRAEGQNNSAQGRAAGYTLSGHGDVPGRIDNDTWAAIFTYNVGGHSLVAGYQSVSSGSNFTQLNQASTGEGAAGASTYLPTDRFASSFLRAGEDTAFGMYSYNFVASGLPGLTASIGYYRGTHIKQAGAADAREWERDIIVDYVIQSGSFQGVGFGLRNAALRSGVPSDGAQDQTRLVMSYTLAMF